MTTGFWGLRPKPQAIALQIQSAVSTEIVALVRQQIVVVGGPVNTGGQLAVGADVDVELHAVIVRQLQQARIVLDRIVIVVVQLASHLQDAVL